MITDAFYFADFTSPIMKGEIVMLHILKIEKHSEAEVYLNDLFALTDTKKDVEVKINELHDKPYNEYIFDENVYQRIKKYLEKEGR